MKAYRCRVCDNPLYFENSRCVSCGSALGYARQERAVVPVDESGRYVDAGGRDWWVCTNLGLSGCTWLAAVEGGQCAACDLTRTRPSDEDHEGLGQFRLAEQAKRHLVVELDTLGLPVVDRTTDPENGLAFDLLSTTEHAAEDNVVIGHDSGVITIDLAESDDAYRERVRARMAEPYRTMLGHFRHEVGHYYEWQLVRGPERMARCRELFGDERADYQAAVDRHYSAGPPADWADSFISTYATMHPFEDFAETWAHYLHICDTIETAGEFGLSPVAPAAAYSTFADLVTGVWIPLTVALNMINRSMGKDDLYPFVIAPPVLDKLDFVASLAPAGDPQGS
ncbi:MAG: putative zinc-binding metallopeptidase [Nocardioides sp.]